MNGTFALIGIFLAAAAGALLIWLTVKLVNRPKKLDRRLWLLAPVLYCLSIGPMGRVAQELDAEWIMYAYFPIALVANKFRPLGEVVLFYLSVCGVKIG